MFGVCLLFTPTFRNSRLHPNVWGFVFFSPRGFYRTELAATWTPRQQLTGRGSHVAAMSAQGEPPPSSVPRSSRAAIATADRSYRPQPSTVEPSSSNTPISTSPARSSASGFPRLPAYPFLQAMKDVTPFSSLLYVFFRRVVDDLF